MLRYVTVSGIGVVKVIVEYRMSITLIFSGKANDKEPDLYSCIYNSSKPAGNIGKLPVCHEIYLHRNTFKPGGKSGIVLNVHPSKTKLVIYRYERQYRVSFV